MSRRRRGSSEFFSQVQDPGKDLFAYLFLVMLVFAFVILLTYEEKMNRQTAQESPREVAAGNTSLVTLDTKRIGRLSRTDGQVTICFGREVFDPVADVERMKAAGFLQQSAGDDSWVLYIEEEPGSKIYLREYLETFAGLSRAGIDVAFAKRAQ